MPEKKYFSDLPRKRVRHTYHALDAARLAFKALGGEDYLLLCALWDNWSYVMGAELASLAFPLGHKKNILLVGAEDSMAMHELSFQRGEILERVNAFMDSAFFAEVQLSLLQARRPLTEKHPVRVWHMPVQQIPPRPPRLGSLGATFAEGSLASSAYVAYVNMFGVVNKG